MGAYDYERVKPPIYFIWHHAVSTEMRGWSDQEVADWFSDIGRYRTYAGFEHSYHYDVRTGQETFSAVPIALVPNGDGSDIYSDTWRVVEIFDWYNNIGWHSGVWNPYNIASVGCETAGRYDDKPFPDNGVVALAEWIRNNIEKENGGNTIILAHNTISATACPGQIVDQFPYLIELINQPANPYPPVIENAVYRFWSSKYQNHFFTANIAERNAIIDNYDDATWSYEGVAFIGMKASDTYAMPVFRFLNPANYAHFYTISRTERDSIIKNDKSWVFEGTAFLAHNAKQSGDSPVYRLWNKETKSHFYTINEAEKNYIIKTSPSIWNYEGIAFYAQKYNG